MLSERSVLVPELSSHAMHHEIWAACYHRHKQRKKQTQNSIRNSLFPWKQTDVSIWKTPQWPECALLGTGAWQACVHSALPCVFLSLISTSVPSGRLIELTGPVLKLSNVGFFRHTHTMCIHVHREKQKQKYIHKNACTDNTHEQGQPRGKCHSYTQAKQWSLQGDMNLKDWLCAEPWEPQNANNSWKCCHRLVIQICTQLST